MTKFKVGTSSGIAILEVKYEEQMRTWSGHSKDARSTDGPVSIHLASTQDERYNWLGHPHFISRVYFDGNKIQCYHAGHRGLE